MTPNDEHNVACLSMHKTGSSAMVAGLQNAGFLAAVHRHFASPEARLSLMTHGAGPQPIGPRLPADEWGASCGPEVPSALVTCVRDPIAQAISAYFQLAQNVKRNRDVEVNPTHAAFAAWFEKHNLFDYATRWFDTNLGEVFDFDFRRHAFDHFRLSIRFESARMKILCLRFEDPLPAREGELGWLVGRQRIALPRVNVTSQKADGTRYRAFVSSFVAPRRWLSSLYEADAVAHFYAPSERGEMRRRWSSADRG